MIERKIKELSIALEALSRINHPQAAQAFEAIEELLGDAISTARKEMPKNDTSDDDILF